jgi:hypothetical protein
MKNTALAIDYLHSLRHGWDPLNIEFNHETLFGEPDTNGVMGGETTERSSILRLSAQWRSRQAS